MIFFLSTKWNRHPLDTYLASWGREYCALIQPLAYEALFSSSRIRPGVYFFADLELLSERQREQAGEIRHELRRRGNRYVSFNDPVNSFRRYDLLTTLRETGINEFSVFRPGDDLETLHYPVFLRYENDHEGARGDMIWGPTELNETLEEARTSGEEDGWLITEFCDTSDSDGVFRKFSAFLLDGRVIPRHVFFSHDWSQKRADIERADLLAEEEEYVRTNPHAQQIREVFRLARIDYGRIDYGIRGGRIQVWEINTNPMILSFDSARPGPRLPVHRRFADAIRPIWEELGSSEAGRSRESYPRQRALAALYRYRDTPTAPALGRWLAGKATAGLNALDAL